MAEWTPERLERFERAYQYAVGDTETTSFIFEELEFDKRWAANYIRRLRGIFAAGMRSWSDDEIHDDNPDVETA